MKWIVGLGNPGRRYARSRHNIGFWIIDRFAEDESFGAERRKFRALYREKRVELRGEPLKVFLVKPQTYMNRSGEAVRELFSYYGMPLEDDLKDTLLVVYDDLDLPEGRLRFRARGSAGGHRGVESVISSLRTQRFSRLRVGIGRRAGVESADYVLESLSGAPLELFQNAAASAAATLRVWLDEGVESCMNRFNAVRDDETGSGRPLGDGGGSAEPRAERRQREETGG